MKLKGLVFFLLFVLAANGQENDIRFQQISLDKGLSQSSVNVILQDSRGFMWFGTQDGLNRYNGYEFVVFKHDPSDYGSISDNFIHAIYEDSRGNLWIGTDWGLNLFNRENETFTRYKHNGSNKNSISSNAILSIGETLDSILLVGTLDGGINELKYNLLEEPNAVQFSCFKKQNKNGAGPSSNSIRCIYTDSLNNVWLGTGSGGLNKWDRKNNSFTPYEHRYYNTPNIDNDQVLSLLEDSKGRFWIGTDTGLELFNKQDETFSRVEWPNFTLFLDTKTSVLSILEDKKGNIWIGTDGYGLLKNSRSDGRVHVYQNHSYLPSSLSNNSVHSIYADNTGALWVGSENGINKFDLTNQNFKHYLHIDNNRNTIYNSVVWGIFKSQNKVYVATEKGLNVLDSQFEKNTFYTKKASNGSSNDQNRFSHVFVDHIGKVWLAADDGLYFLNEKTQSVEKFKCISKPCSSLNNRKIYSIFEDSKNNLWLSTKQGLLILNNERNLFYLHQTRAGAVNTLGSNNVRTVFEDNEGRIWVGTHGGGLNKVVFNFYHPENLSELTFIRLKIQETKPFSINNNVVLTICQDQREKNTLWIGTFGGGLNRFNVETGQFWHYTEKEGLSNNVIYGILQDNNNKLWMSTNNGLSCFNPASKSFKNYHAADGLQSNEFNAGAYFKSDDGELFFGGINGLNVFTPEEISSNAYPPKVVITNFKVFNLSAPKSSNYFKGAVYDSKEFHVGYKDRFFSFTFSALHYTSSEKNTYKYMLQGYDEDWVYAGERREAYYSNLEPGRYDFKVLAANSDGVWSTDPTVVVVYVSPPFYKTWLFRFLVVAVFFATIIFFVNYRMRGINEQKRELENQIEARTKEILLQNIRLENQNQIIEQEKDKVEKLLLNILPHETVEELKTKGKASARSYRTASVMFTDFRGFTKIAESLNPQELIAELDTHFIKFDEIIEKYGLEKIKTIGDAYMCCGGLPIRNKSNPVDIVLAGLAIQRYMEELKISKMARGQKYWDLRIGIHSGELIAGVVGIKRFAYDVWGDTVNIAARMESSGEIGKVNISGRTYKTAREFFVCTYRGKVQAKNKGEIDMYFVHSIRPELSVDGAGIEPNEDFYHRLDHILYSNINYKNAEQHIIKLLSDNLPEGLFYHGLHHTLDVCRAAEEIAKHEGVEGEDLYLLKTAALYHDSGFTKQYEKNEPIGVALARQTLPQFGYSDKQIDAIEKIIISTQIPQNPHTLLECIMCDADLDYLGRDDFHEIATNLKRELMAFGKISGDKAWDIVQVPFLEKHHYFTEYSKRVRAQKKQSRIKEIKARIALDQYDT